MTTVSIVFEADQPPGKLLENLFLAAVSASVPRPDQSLGRPWIEVSPDLYFWAATTVEYAASPVTMIERLLQRFPEVAGIRIAGSNNRPLRPSILELAPREFFKKRETLPGFSKLLEKYWRAQAKEVIDATPPGHFALFSAPTLEDERMVFRLAYLPEGRRRESTAGLDPSVSWYAGPVNRSAPTEAT